MRAFKFAIFTVLAIIVFISVHCIFINRLSRNMEEKLSEVENFVDVGDYNSAYVSCSELEKKFERQAVWLHVTIESKEVRDIENSIYKTKELIEKNGDENLYAEIALLRKMLEYVPAREGFSLIEIL